MAKQSRDWNEGLKEDLKDSTFAQGFIIAAMKEGIPLIDTLRKVIRVIGIQEIADKLGVTHSGLLHFMNPRYKPTQGVLDCLLKPFGLKISLSLIKPETPSKC